MTGSPVPYPTASPTEAPCSSTSWELTGVEGPAVPLPPAPPGTSAEPTDPGSEMTSAPAANVSAGPSPNGFLSATLASPTGDAVVQQLSDQMAVSRIGETAFPDPMEL